VLACLRDGMSNKQIGSKLKLSEKTVKHHVTSMLQKLHVKNRVQAAVLVSKLAETSGTDQLRAASPPSRLASPVPGFARVAARDPANWTPLRSVRPGHPGIIPLKEEWSGIESM
jgi:hypothetical protein